MSKALKNGCRKAVNKYADAAMQANASLFCENKEYVATVIRLYTEHYNKLVASNATQWQESQKIEDYLNSIKPIQER